MYLYPSFCCNVVLDVASAPSSCLPAFTFLLFQVLNEMLGCNAKQYISLPDKEKEMRLAPLEEGIFVSVLERRTWGPQRSTSLTIVAMRPVKEGGVFKNCLFTNGAFAKSSSGKEKRRTKKRSDANNASSAGKKKIKIEGVPSKGKGPAAGGASSSPPSADSPDDNSVIHIISGISDDSDACNNDGNYHPSDEDNDGSSSSSNNDDSQDSGDDEASSDDSDCVVND